MELAFFKQERTSAMYAVSIDLATQSNANMKQTSSVKTNREPLPKATEKKSLQKTNQTQVMLTIDLQSLLLCPDYRLVACTTNKPYIT